MIRSILTLEKPRNQFREIKFRDIKSLEIEALKEDIKNSKLVKNCNDMSLDTLIETYDSELTVILNKHARVTTRRVRLQRREPWFNDIVKEAIREMRSHERKFTKHKFDTNYKNQFQAGVVKKWFLLWIAKSQSTMRMSSRTTEPTSTSYIEG